MTGQHSPNICHVCCLCMRHRPRTSLKRVLSGRARSASYATARANKTRTRNRKTPHSPPSPLCITPCHSVQCKLAYKPRFCHNLHIKLAQHFRRLPDWLPQPAAPPSLRSPPFYLYSPGQYAQAAPAAAGDTWQSTWAHLAPCCR